METDPVFAVDSCGDPQVVRNTHPLVISLEVNKIPRFLPLLFVHIGIKGKAVQLTVFLYGREKEGKTNSWVSAC